MIISCPAQPASRSIRHLLCHIAFMRINAYLRQMDSKISELLNALSEPTRLRALQIIWDGDEHCVCELMDRLKVTQSRMSRHMTRLKVAGLLTDRRDAQWVRYRRRPDLPKPWVAVIDSVLAALAPPSDGQHEQRAA